MSRHQRLRHSLRSPDRAARSRRSRQGRVLRRELMVYFTEQEDLSRFRRQLLLDEMLGMQVRHPAPLVLGPLTG